MVWNGNHRPRPPPPEIRARLSSSGPYMLKQAKFCATPPLFGWFSVTEGSVFRENLLIFNAEGSAVHEILPVLSMYAYQFETPYELQRVTSSRAPNQLMFRLGNIS